VTGSAPRIAILGANGQIGTGLIQELSGEFNVYAVVRNGSTYQDSRVAEVLSYDQLLDHEFFLIINAAGPGDPQLQRTLGHEMFRITEGIDNVVLQYLDRHPSTKYLFVSTGAVHRFLPAGGANFSIPVPEVPGSDCYAVSKLLAETKHRSLSSLTIWDVRVFGYFSRHIAADRTFFLSDLRTSLARGVPFRTHGTDFVRDYISFDDLAALVRALLRANAANMAVDVFSAMPLTKAELLETCRSRYGLKIEFESGSTEIVKVTKPRVISDDTAGAAIGYVPLRTSMETVLREMDHLLRAEK